MRIAVCGGVYSNPWALRAFIEDAHRNHAERLYCLGDLGGYGAAPEAVWSLLTDNDVVCVAGNYDVAIASGADDCGCGYPDPRDQEYAQVMYDYTLANTSRSFAEWMGTLPTERRETLAGCDVHFVHGSTVGLNDFWWESLPAQEHRRRVDASGADVILCTHSGLPWTRRIEDTLVVNVGVIGRPANDGDRRVRYALIDLEDGNPRARIVRLHYDWRAHSEALRDAGMPEAFAHTSSTGWWTTCLEALPSAERARGRFHVYDSSVPTLLEALGLPSGAWPDPDPSIPVRSLWGSPLFPDRIWCYDSPIEIEELAESSGCEVTRVRADERAPAARRIGRGRTVLPELTLTRDGWFWHPRSVGEQPVLPHPLELPMAKAFVDAARIAVARRLLEELQSNRLLAPARYCAA
ncbi:metallophosphoesterase family protein [Sphaerisporangium viridialbum]|uniref:metallophosphoesterase family protein n=1 Tax=Sphaerisporangium viridialbum TaxID=46189 RepID=UPI003C7159EC